MGGCVEVGVPGNYMDQDCACSAWLCMLLQCWLSHGWLRIAGQQCVKVWSHWVLTYIMHSGWGGGLLGMLHAVLGPCVRAVVMVSGRVLHGVVQSAAAFSGGRAQADLFSVLSWRRLGCRMAWVVVHMDCSAYPGFLGAVVLVLYLLCVFCDVLTFSLGCWVPTHVWWCHTVDSSMAVLLSRLLTQSGMLAHCRVLHGILWGLDSDLCCDGAGSDVAQMQLPGLI